MKAKRAIIVSLAMLLLVFMGISPAAGAVSAAAGEVRVPLALDISEPIAGAEFQLELPPELKVRALEKSGDIMSASMTPVVEKGNIVNLGFYSAGNDFEPRAGVLDIGFLVIDCPDDARHSLTITEVKTVRVIDKETTQSETITLNQVVNIPLESENMVHVGKASVLPWVILAAVAVAAGIGTLVVFRILKKRRTGA